MSLVKTLFKIYQKSEGVSENASNNEGLLGIEECSDEFRRSPFGVIKN